MSPSWQLPPEDRELSPFTGYTRAHWLAVADRLLGSAWQYASPAGARLSPPGRTSWSGADSDGLEGFARTFLLAALRIAGEGGEDPAGLLPRYAAGLAAGVSPQHAEAWPGITPAVRQTVVEAASISMALHLTRPWLWDRLTAASQEEAVSWLSGAGALWELEIPDNNWHLFRVLIAAFLTSVGAPIDAEVVAADRARVEEFWVGGGWYRDGKLGPQGPIGDAFDHYCGWAMHTYPAFIDLVAGHGSPSAVATGRLREYLGDLVHLVGSDGAPLHQGRSLIYRFAAAAAPWTGALTGAGGLSPGLTRRLASGMLRHFVQRGFTDAAGLPTLGWYEEFLPMVQPYSAPASPFWLAKGFIGLLLPASHPCWTEVEEPLPAESADQVRAMPEPGWLATSRRSDGIVRIANHGSDDQPPLSGIDDPQYARLGYSTATGPMLAAPEELGAADNHIGLHDPVRGLTRRTRIHRIQVTDRWAASWHEARWADGTPSGARISSATLWLGDWELRAHVIRNIPPGCRVREFGWQLAAAQAPLELDADRGVAAEAEGLCSWLVPLTAGTVSLVRTEHTSAYGRHAATPAVEYQPTGDRHVQVTLVGLGRDLPAPPRVDWSPGTEGIDVAVNGSRICLPLSERRSGGCGVRFGPRPGDD